MKMRKYNWKVAVMFNLYLYTTHDTYLRVKNQKDFLNVYIGDTLFNYLFMSTKEDKNCKLPLIYPYKLGNKWILVANNEWDKLKGSIKASTIFMCLDLIDKCIDGELTNYSALMYSNCLTKRAKTDDYLLEYYVILRTLLISKYGTDHLPPYMYYSESLFELKKFCIVLVMIEPWIFKDTYVSRFDKYCELLDKYTEMIDVKYGSTWHKRALYLVNKYAYED